MNHKIAPATIARTAALALALTNQVLSATGHAMLPIESAQLEQLVSTGLTVAAALISWWKNNSFTPEAIEADDYFCKLKEHKQRKAPGTARFRGLCRSLLSCGKKRMGRWRRMIVKNHLGQRSFLDMSGANGT